MSDGRLNLPEQNVLASNVAKTSMSIESLSYCVADGSLAFFFREAFGVFTWSKKNFYYNMPHLKNDLNGHQVEEAWTNSFYNPTGQDQRNFYFQVNVHL